MTDTDLGSGDDWSPADEAAFSAMERGEAPPTGDTPPGPDAALPADAGAAAAAPAGDTPPAAAPAAAPGDVVEPEDEGDPEQNKGKFVRHGAFHSERMKRKGAEQEVTRLRDLLARGDERLRLLSGAMQQGGQPAQQPAAQAPAAPDPNEDIFGYAKHLEQQIAELKQGQQSLTEAQQAEREHSQTVGAYHADIQRFAQAEPAFVDAYQHLIASRAQELAFAGVPQAEINRAIQADELALVRQAIAAGVSPAERVFQLAKVRGFAPKVPEPAAAAATIPAAPAETPEQKAARTAGAANAARSLSTAGGAPAAEMTLEQLASMSEAEFEAYAAKNPKRLAALMGDGA
ncbi:hypothetical protein [uncultured Methylobacterium sp.]|jgi:hypothetical protein|uniref:hypothetical protein n=1 Tax=uncultured Methylobacterium sp. TaxID=157278 RepID=UPI00262FD154|nr:hypothetical protein [uncultured Methylobacterium sp.]